MHGSGGAKVLPLSPAIVLCWNEGTCYSKGFCKVYQVRFLVLMTIVSSSCSFLIDGYNALVLVLHFERLARSVSAFRGQIKFLRRISGHR